MPVNLCKLRGKLRVRLGKALLISLMSYAVPTTGAMAVEEKDPYLYLEEVQGKAALAFARKLNRQSTRALESSTGFEARRKQLLNILDDRQKIPYVSKHGNYYYNFWQDEDHPRGVYRRTSLSQYKLAKPQWEEVLDLDKLAKDEKENWVFEGSVFLEPENDRCLLSLSRGGSDASVVREFDLIEKRFLKDGFNLPAAKSQISYRNKDQIYVGTDFGPGSLTDSGYPRLIKEWQRGTPLSSARLILEGKKEDVSVSGISYYDHGRRYDFLSRRPAFFKEIDYVRLADDDKGAVQLRQIDKPDDASFSVLSNVVFLRLRSPYTAAGKTYPAGALLALDFDKFLAGSRAFTMVFEPSPRTSYGYISATKNYFLLNTLENAASHVYLLKGEKEKFAGREITDKQYKYSQVSAWGVDSDETEDYFMTVESFLTPTTLYLGNAEQEATEKLKSQPQFFPSDNLEVRQFEADSKDGTRIPYFLVGAKNLEFNGKNPTLLYGYGGFEVSMTPGYRALTGSAWLAQGGVYVLANIRGGGEFGPTWHKAARKENRQRAYDDFIAVAEDLIKRKVTSREHLGIEGGSNGGLLMGVMFTQRPDLFGAVVCGSPLLDMKRYTHLLAGASWIDEYGDPDKAEEWTFIGKYSPYHNLKAGVDYPPLLITTSTLDDRVHPGHARKFAARLKELGHQLWYYENIEGGHSAAANNKQTAYMKALSYSFLWKVLAGK